MEIGKKIKDFRMQKGITQETLAGILSVSSQAVSKWETGQALPDIQILPEIAVYFGVTIDELFSMDDDKEFDRIQNMLWDERDIGAEKQSKAERWLLEKAENGYRPSDCYALLADMYNHIAREAHRKAAEFAWESLQLEAGEKDAFCELNEAMEGYTPDWCARNHNRLINRLKEYLQAHPDSWKGHLWLLDNLIDDHRMKEAEEYAEKLAAINDTYRVPLYKGLIKWHSGEKDKAHEIWKEMERSYGDEWQVHLCMGDVMAMEGLYQDAIAYYRNAVSIQKAPRYVDGYDSIAHIYEITGDNDLAVKVLEEELTVLKEEWDTVSGETADSVRNWIRRLNAK
ncbi:MAG: helix-turn-helix domain-containing protein [Parasporobacterium sp.]|nr:helix-turn-helix domain-containing protein [Parasporobacterium sp.]